MIFENIFGNFLRKRFDGIKIILTDSDEDSKKLIIFDEYNSKTYRIYKDKEEGYGTGQDGLCREVEI